MKKLKIDFVLAAALLVGGGFAASTTQATPAKKTAVAQWIRKGSSANPNQDNTWQQGSATSCLSASKLCSGTFPDGYDPNSHSDTENRANTTTSIVQGYVP